jgi:hypothetical protein
LYAGGLTLHGWVGGQNRWSQNDIGRKAALKNHLPVFGLIGFFHIHFSVLVTPST